MENKNTRKNTRRKNNIRKTRKKNTRRKNTRRKNTRNKNIRKTRRKNTRRKYTRRKKKNLKGGSSFSGVKSQGYNNIAFQINGKGNIEVWDILIRLDDRKLSLTKKDDLSVRREADLRGCKVSPTKKSRGKGKHWLRVDLQRNDQTTSGVSVDKYVFGFDTEGRKSRFIQLIEMASLNEGVDDEITIDYGEEGIQQLAELLKLTERHTGKRKHTTVIIANHGGMKRENFYIPEGIEIIMKGSIGHITRGFQRADYFNHIVHYQFLNAIDHYVTQGDIVDEEGCVNPGLAYALTNRQLSRSDIADVNVKISGKSDGRQELPEDFKDENGNPKQQLTNSEIEQIDEEILRQYYANNVNMHFSDINYYEKHGLLFEVQVNIQHINDEVAELERSERNLSSTESSRAQFLRQISETFEELTAIETGKEKYKVRLSLVTPKEVSEFRDIKDIPINGRVMETLTKLRELTGHEFVVFFGKCRVNARVLNKQLSRKTDKSIDCWLKWYHDNLIKRFADVLDTQKLLKRGKITVEAEQFLIEFSQYLKSAFSSMNDVYDTLKEYLSQNPQGTMQDTQPIERVLLSGNKKEIIDLVLLSCYLNCLSGFNFEESFVEKLTRIIKEKISEMVLIIPLTSKSVEDLRLLEYLFENEDIHVDTTVNDGHSSPLSHAAANGNLEVVKYLLENGVDVNIQDGDVDGTTPVFHAASLGHLKVVTTLVNAGAHFNIKDENDYTPLMYAAEIGHHEVVKYLVEKGANIEAVDEQGMTPLIKAVEKGHLEIVKLLVDAEANKEAENKAEETPLLIAASLGNEEIVKLLVDAEANKEAENKAGATPLLIAASLGNEEIVKLLVDAEANKEAVDKTGETPLLKAVYGGQLEIIQYLVDGGANIEAVDSSGNTPLLKAAEIGKLEIIQYLLERGANIEAVDSSGNTPLLKAAETHKLEIVEYLVHAGANKEAKNILRNDEWSNSFKDIFTRKGRK